MVVIKLTFYFSLLISITGCAIYDISPKAIRKTYSYTNLEKKISGIYIPSSATDSSVFYIFYEDNTFVVTFRQVWIELQEAEDNDKRTYFFYRYNSWGYYSIKEDGTIVLKKISHRPYGNGYWTSYESIFIMDHLKLIGVSENQTYPIDVIIKSENDTTKLDGSNQYSYDLTFYDSCDCKTSDTWLKYEKWFWKNEQDYIEWIEKSGGDKKKYHK